MKIRIYLLLIILSLPFLATSQKDSLENILYQPVYSCQEISNESHVLLSELAWNDIGESREILKKWESSCGLLEPIFRLNILLDIYDGKEINSTFYSKANYAAFNAYEYKIRHARRAAFDSMTISLANLILKTKELSKEEKLFALYYSNNFPAFYENHRLAESLMDSLSPLNRNKPGKSNMIVEFNLSSAIHIGQWKDAISNAHQIGLVVGRTRKYGSWGLEANLDLLNPADSILFTYEDTEKYFRPKLGMKFGPRFNIDYYRNKNDVFTLSGIFSAKGAVINAVKKKDEEGSNNRSYLGVTGFHIGAGLKASWRMGKYNYRRFGIHVLYDYANYGKLYINRKLYGHSIKMGVNVNLN